MSFPRKEYHTDQAKKYWSLAEAKVKLAAFCAYQERCQQEVRLKLMEKGIHGDPAEDLIAEMISEGFLNEERFAQAFTRGKFNLKKWGRVKISLQLKSKQVSPNCIKSGLKEIDPDEYMETLKDLVEKKSIALSGLDVFKKKYKIHQYLLSRGFEHDLIQEAIESVF
jgi:regulatory protein